MLFEAALLNTKKVTKNLTNRDELNDKMRSRHSIFTGKLLFRELELKKAEQLGCIAYGITMPMSTWDTERSTTLLTQSKRH